MTSKHWSTTVNGAPATVSLDDDSVTVAVAGATTCWSRTSLKVSYPTSFAALFTGEGQELAVGFRSTSEQREFREALTPGPANIATAHIQLSSLLQPIGRETVASLGFVRAHAVMSRNVLSDA